jgi:hypothetical protein
LKYYLDELRLQSVTVNKQHPLPSALNSDYTNVFALMTARPFMGLIESIVIVCVYILITFYIYALPISASGIESRENEVYVSVISEGRTKAYRKYSK